MKFRVPVKLVVEVEASSGEEARSLARAVYTKLPTKYESAEDAILGKRTLNPALGPHELPIVEIGKPVAVKEPDQPTRSRK